MADHGQAEYATAEGNDLPAHEAMYDRFVHLVAIGSAHVAPKSNCSASSPPLILESSLIVPASPGLRPTFAVKEYAWPSKANPTSS